MILHIEKSKIDTLFAYGYPAIEEMITEGLGNLRYGKKAYSRGIMTQDGPRAFYVYKSVNFVHFDAEGIYGIVSMNNNEMVVEDLSDSFIKRLKQLPVRDFHKVLREADDAPLSLSDELAEEYQLEHSAAYAMQGKKIEVDI